MQGKGKRVKRKRRHNSRRTWSKGRTQLKAVRLNNQRIKRQKGHGGNGKKERK